VGTDAHTYKYEGGGAAALGGIQPQTLDFGDNGELDLAKVKNLIKEDDFHFARTRLLCLENTQHGRVQSLDYLKSAQQFAKEQGLQIHLDGARMANAAVALGVDLKSIGGCFDTVSLCLSKGLGAPIGSLWFQAVHRRGTPLAQSDGRWHASGRYVGSRWQDGLNRRL
jgi:threonine aldolase